MKFSLIKNDKSTFWDEVILAIMIFCSMAAGIMLIIFKPEFWIISSNASVQFGVIFTLFGLMFIPGLIFRLMTNDKR
ncbi:MAG: hypothetical protein K6G19_00220 [Lachnospiraceae bacterium]|nr:hypothetical protein [Lachnospiraceae bacterium]